ncbi:MAG TPA: NAD(P)-dependent oxidoreductase [Gammaproteobacteria bacterium]|nr:NAD(P)-dependent oxidoreductase [Gammaproteobacteria bacterium]
MNKKVMVTGGLGFIGRHTLQPLLARGYEVHVISSRLATAPAKEWQVHQADLLNCATHEALMKSIRPSYLLHAAWYTENGQFWNAIENAYWLSASISLVRSFYAEGGKRLLALGTCAEYDWSAGVCVEESTLERPSTLYGRFKKFTAEALSLLAKHHQGSFVWGRVFFPYGPFEPRQRLIPSVICSLLQNETAKCSHGRQIRDFIYVEDLGQALAAILDSTQEGIVNLGSGKPVTIQEVAHCIGDLLGKRDQVLLGAIPESLNSPSSIVASTKRLNEDWGWTPQFSLQQGLEKTISWWQKKGP